jgi:hypothetical protein
MTDSIIIIVPPETLNRVRIGLEKYPFPAAAIDEMSFKDYIYWFKNAHCMKDLVYHIAQTLRIIFNFHPAKRDQMITNDHFSPEKIVMYISRFSLINVKLAKEQLYDYICNGSDLP